MTQKLKSLIPALLIILVCSVHLFAQVVIEFDDKKDTSSMEDTYPRVKVSGSLGFGVMKIINSSLTQGLALNPLDTTFYNGVWRQSYSGQLRLKVSVTEKLVIDIAMSGGIYHGLQSMKAGLATMKNAKRRKSRWLGATGSYKVGDVKRPLMVIKAGYFGFNYQHDIKNLGGYLLRSGTYPGVVYSGGGGSGYLGVGIHCSYVQNVKQDLIINLGGGNLTLVYVASYDIGGKGILDVGGGTMFTNLLQVDPEWTISDVHGFNEPIRLDFDRGLTMKRDSVFYNSRGVKVAARFRFDPKPLFNSALLGKQDLWLYSEAAILGVKSYPLTEDSTVGYDNILERIPVLVGFNVPAFKLLDYLALEFEWYQFPYRNISTSNALPSPPLGDKGESDNFKWSVSTGRKIFKFINVYARAASDHIRFINENGSWDKEELVQRPDEWYLQFGMSVSF